MTVITAYVPRPEVNSLLGDKLFLTHQAGVGEPSPNNVGQSINGGQLGQMSLGHWCTTTPAQ